MDSIQPRRKTRQSRNRKIKPKKQTNENLKPKLNQTSILQFLSGKSKNIPNINDNPIDVQNINTPNLQEDQSEKVSLTVDSPAYLNEYEKFVLKRLNKFYTIDKIERIKPIINQESDISLRLIDWTLTNYCKKYVIVIRKRNGEIVDIYETYKAKLDSYPKNELLDVFKRGSRIRFYYSDNEDDYIITSVKQLNIFKWLLEDEILDYIEKYREQINEDHRESLRRSKTNKAKNRGKGKKSRRQELSKSAYKRCIRVSQKNIISLAPD